MLNVFSPKHCDTIRAEHNEATTPEPPHRPLAGAVLSSLIRPTQLPNKCGYCLPDITPEGLIGNENGHDSDAYQNGVFQGRDGTRVPQVTGKLLSNTCGHGFFLEQGETTATERATGF